MEGLVPQLLAGASQEVFMLTVIIEVDAPVGMAQAVKEDLAMLLERYGDTRVVEVRSGQRDR